MHYIFKATPRSLLVDGILPPLFFGVVGGLATYLNQDVQRLLSELFLVGGVLGCLLFITRPLLGQRLEIDGWNLRSGGFSLAWKDVLAVWIEPVHQHEYMLYLGTGRGIARLSLRWMDVDAVWEAVQACAPRLALEPEAPTRLTGVKQVIANDQQLSESQVTPLEVRFSPLLAGLLGLGITMCFIAAFFAFNTGQVEPLPLFLALALLCALGLTNYQVVEMDSEGISERSLLGHFRLRWSEIELLTHDPQGNVLVFHAGAKRLAIIGASYWTGSDKQKMLRLLELKLAHNQVKTRRDVWLMVKLVWSKGCRVEERDA